MPLPANRAFIAIAILLIANAGVLVWHPVVPAVQPAADFPADQVARGAELAAVGDCTVCHTADPSHPYAGGRGIPTPFGTVYATNITPDPATGIGRWSRAAFQRAMRDGIDRVGRQLYPVLPYPHFTRATDQDIGAMYAFLMTRPPVRQQTPPNRLPFPLNLRFLLAGWNLLYLRFDPWHPDPSHDAVWNRGAYLVSAIGHCGACHSPRNALGAEDHTARLTGGEAEAWYAPPLQAASPARQPWTEVALSNYLRTGFDQQHGAAAGPMTAVTQQLSRVPDADIRAIAVYIASMMPHASPVAATVPIPPAVDPQAQALFDGACGGCHAADAPMTQAGAPSLVNSTAVNAPTPRSVIQVILQGIPWRDGPAPYMPAFASALTDAQVAAITAYLRTNYSNRPAWTNLPADVAKARKAT